MRVYRRLAVLALVATPFLAMAAEETPLENVQTTVTEGAAAAVTDLKDGAAAVQTTVTEGAGAATDAVNNLAAGAATATDAATTTTTDAAAELKEVLQAAAKSIDDVIVSSKPATEGALAGVVDAIKDTTAVIEKPEELVKKVAGFTIRLDKEGCYVITDDAEMNLKLCVDDALSRDALTMDELKDMGDDVVAKAEAAVKAAGDATTDAAKPAFSLVEGTVTNMGNAPVCDFAFASAATDLTQETLKMDPINLPVTPANVVPKEMIDLAPAQEIDFSFVLPFDQAKNIPAFVGIADTAKTCAEVKKAFTEAVEAATGAADAATGTVNAATGAATGAAAGATETVTQAGADAQAKVEQTVADAAKAVEEVTAHGEADPAAVETTSPAGKAALSSALVLGAAVAAGLALLA